MSFSWLAEIDPAWGAWITIVAYLGLLIWCVTRPRRMIVRGAPDHARWRDLRLWVLPLILIQVGLYWLFR